jgi:hypothetical protein
MDCIIDMSIIETLSKKPTLDDFKTFNKGGPDIENQLEIVEEYKDLTQQSRSPLASVFSRVNVFSFLPIFGTV